MANPPTATSCTEIKEQSGNIKIGGKMASRHGRRRAPDQAPAVHIKLTCKRHDPFADHAAFR
jgi:hypothetical protein